MQYDTDEGDEFRYGLHPQRSAQGGQGGEGGAGSQGPRKQAEAKAPSQQQQPAGRHREQGGSQQGVGMAGAGRGSASVLSPAGLAALSRLGQPTAAAPMQGVPGRSGAGAGAAGGSKARVEVVDLMDSSDDEAGKKQGVLPVGRQGSGPSSGQGQGSMLGRLVQQSNGQGNRQGRGSLLHRLVQQGSGQGQGSLLARQSSGQGSGQGQGLMLDRLVQQGSGQGTFLARQSSGQGQRLPVAMGSQQGGGQGQGPVLQQQDSGQGQGPVLQQQDSGQGQGPVLQQQGSGQGASAAMGSQQGSGSMQEGGAGSGVSVDRAEAEEEGAGCAALAYRWALPTLGGPPPTELPLPPLPPGRTFTQEYDVVLILDSREQFTRWQGGHQLARTEATTAHANALRARGTLVEERTLGIGDVTWVARLRSQPATEYMLGWVLERKSCGDLLSSIQVGNKQRFQRQKWWLLRCGLPHVAYLLEGNPDREVTNPSDNKTCKTVAVGNELDGFRVMRSSGPQDTLAVLSRLTAAIGRGAAAACARGGREAGSPLQYAAWNERVKRMRGDGNRSVRDVFGCMLSVIPGMGPNTVEAILEKYPTVAALHAAYTHAAISARLSEQDPLVAQQGLLAGLSLASGGIVGAGRSRDAYDHLFREQPATL